MINLQSILFKKYLDQKLASFYIINYDSRNTDPNNWVNEFITLFTKIQDHPDILKITKEEKETEYKVDSKSILNFTKFINYKPIDLEKKNYLSF